MSRKIEAHKCELRDQLLSLASCLIALALGSSVPPPFCNAPALFPLAPPEV